MYLLIDCSSFFLPILVSTTTILETEGISIKMDMSLEWQEADGQLELIELFLDMSSVLKNEDPEFLEFLNYITAPVYILILRNRSLAVFHQQNFSALHDNLYIHFKNFFLYAEKYNLPREFHLLDYPFFLRLLKGCITLAEFEVLTIYSL